MEYETTNVLYHNKKIKAKQTKHCDTLGLESLVSKGQRCEKQYELWVKVNVMVLP